MARKRGPDRPPKRGDAAERIARQWEQAKARNPKLTPGDWAQRVFPPRLDPEGRQVARTKRGAAATLRAILEGRANETAEAILDRTASKYKVTVGGYDAHGRVVWVTNIGVDSGQPPGELDSDLLLPFVIASYQRGIGSPPRNAVQGEPPIVHAEVFRVPKATGGWIGGSIPGNAPWPER